MKAAYCQYKLKFKQPAITSRATMHEKETFFIKLWEESTPNVYGLGECAIFRGLSADDRPDYEQVLIHVCRNINDLTGLNLDQYSSIKFGLETAFNDLSNGGNRIIFPSEWSNGNSVIQINGLVWMGSFKEMYHRISEKLDKGFKCVKLKVGGIDFESELNLLKFIREQFAPSQLELRVDANGAFSAENALTKLSQLSKFQIHSIEQPIKPHQYEAMADICEKSPIPVALDEELIGIDCYNEKLDLIDKIKPHYLILKPSLCGGFSGAEEWITLAKAKGIGWWATSALESNIGLNAISQWVATLNPQIPQGLGTGQLYTNNIESPLLQTGEVIKYDNNQQWQIPALNWVEP